MEGWKNALDNELEWGKGPGFPQYGSIGFNGVFHKPWNGDACCKKYLQSPHAPERERCSSQKIKSGNAAKRTTSLTILMCVTTLCS